MRLFLDANVLFAASVSPQGRSASLFLFASRQECTLLPSPHVVTEARRNLDAKAPDAVARFRELLGLVTVVPEAPPATVRWAREQGLPAEDAPVLAAAVAAGADALVTGDVRHFSPLFGRTMRGVRVMRLADALKSLLA